MEYQYPMDYNWSTVEIVDVIHFFEAVERAYEKGIVRDELLGFYRRFKEIVPGKAQEKMLCNEFEEMSGYSSYRAIKQAKESGQGTKVKM
jgi:uncharacterized protein YktA (UPF0223 family)